MKSKSRLGLILGLIVLIFAIMIVGEVVPTFNMDRADTHDIALDGAHNLFNERLQPGDSEVIYYKSSTGKSLLIERKCLTPEYIKTTYHVINLEETNQDKQINTHKSNIRWCNDIVSTGH